MLRPAALIAAQAVFWIWTFPANVATNNWTMQPDNWATLRTQWEYSHLAGAGFQAVAMVGLVVAVLERGREGAFTRAQAWPLETDQPTRLKGQP